MTRGRLLTIGTGSGSKLRKGSFSLSSKRGLVRMIVCLGNCAPCNWSESLTKIAMSFKDL